MQRTTRQKAGRRGRRCLVAAASLALLVPTAALAQSGGVSGDGGTSGGSTGDGGPGEPCFSSGANFTIKSTGKACSPAGAPQRVIDVVQAANSIRNYKYFYGGGHSGWSKDSRGYDCSGAVSYALHGGGWLSYPRSSGGFMNWGEGQKTANGEWIKVYPNSGHVWMKIKNPNGTDNGIRWDTSDVGGDSVEGSGPSTGPDWHRNPRSSSGFRKRHPKKYTY